MSRILCLSIRQPWAWGYRIGRKEEREAVLDLWHTWFQGVRSYTLNLFSGAITDGEHLLPPERRRMTARYLDVTTSRGT
jgi:hypothetical protein